MSAKECAAVGCRHLILPYALFCDDCWQKTPSDLKRLIGKHHIPGRKPSKILERWIAQVERELLYVRVNGIARPRDGSFEWDDAPAAPDEKQELLLE